MSVTPNDVIDVAPEFVTEDPLRIARFIERAERRVNEVIWREKTDDGIAYLAAHLLKMSQQAKSGDVGQVTSQKVGDLARSFATSSMEKGSISKTNYGLIFLELQRTLVTSPVLIS